MTETAAEWTRHFDSNQYHATIAGVECWIDTPYDDTVCYRIHVFRNHPRYPHATMTATATGDSGTWEGAVLLAARYARDIAQWCSGPVLAPGGREGGEGHAGE